MSTELSNTLPQFGENLKAIRKAKGITQVELAEALGTSQVYIAKIEAGKSNVYLSVAVKIAEALKTPLKKFLEKNN